jgi:hypothetical protein
MMLLLEAGFKSLDQRVTTPVLHTTKRLHLLAAALHPRPFQHSLRLLLIAIRLSPPPKRFCVSLVHRRLMALDSVAFTKWTTFQMPVAHPTFSPWRAAAQPPTLPGTLAFLPSTTALSWAPR